jgi:outer membrane immunogenic protein
VGHSQCIPWADYYTEGGFFGGQIGYNHQIDSIWVAGVEADYQWADLPGQGVSRFRLGQPTAPTSMNTSATVDQSVRSFGTARLRLAWHQQSRLSCSSSMQTSMCRPAGRAGFLPEAITLIAAAPQVRPVFRLNVEVGWTLGVGTEYALSNNFTLKGEALYVDPGDYTATVTATNGNGNRPAFFTASLSPVGLVLARGGLNFRF